VHELPTVAVIEPRVKDKEGRAWDTSLTIHFADGATMTDTDPGHAVMEVLGLYAEDEGTPRWRRVTRDLPIPERNERVIVNNHPGPLADGEDQVRDGAGSISALSTAG